MEEGKLGFKVVLCSVVFLPLSSAGTGGRVQSLTAQVSLKLSKGGMISEALVSGADLAFKLGQWFTSKHQTMFVCLFVF